MHVFPQESTFLEINGMHSSMKKTLTKIVQHWTQIHIGSGNLREFIWILLLPGDVMMSWHEILHCTRSWLDWSGVTTALLPNYSNPTTYQLFFTTIMNISIFSILPDDCQLHNIHEEILDTDIANNSMFWHIFVGHLIHNPSKSLIFWL